MERRNRSDRAKKKKKVDEREGGIRFTKGLMQYLCIQYALLIESSNMPNKHVSKHSDCVV